MLRQNLDLSKTIVVPAIAVNPEETMGHLLLLMGVALRAACRGRADLVLENLALRQQVAVLPRAGRRPCVSTLDRWFWVVLRRVWSRWTEVLVSVNPKPETVVRWDRAGFRLYWNWLAMRGRGGRPSMAAEVRALVRRLATENG